jgi:hypothetical protein
LVWSVAPQCCASIADGPLKGGIAGGPRELSLDTRHVVVDPMSSQFAGGSPPAVSQLGVLRLGSKRRVYPRWRLGELLAYGLITGGPMLTPDYAQSLM